MTSAAPSHCSHAGDATRSLELHATARKVRKLQLSHNSNLIVISALLKSLLVLNVLGTKFFIELFHKWLHHASCNISTITLVYIILIVL